MKKFSLSLLLLSCVLHGSQVDTIINDHKNDIIDGTKKYAHLLERAEDKLPLSMLALNQDIRYIDARKKQCAQISSTIAAEKLALQGKRAELEKMRAKLKEALLKEFNRQFNPRTHARVAHAALADFQRLPWERQEEVAAQSVVPGIYTPEAVIDHRQQKIAQKEYIFYQLKQGRLAGIDSSLQLIQSDIDRTVAGQEKIKLQQRDVAINVSGYDALRFTYVKLRKDQQESIFGSFIEKHIAAQLNNEREFKVLRDQQEKKKAEQLQLLREQYDQEQAAKLKQAKDDRIAQSEKDKAVHQAKVEARKKEEEERKAQELALKTKKHEELQQAKAKQVADSQKKEEEDLAKKKIENELLAEKIAENLEKEKKAQEDLQRQKEKAQEDLRRQEEKAKEDARQKDERYRLMFDARSNYFMQLKQEARHTNEQILDSMRKYDRKSNIFKTPCETYSQSVAVVKDLLPRLTEDNFVLIDNVVEELYSCYKDLRKLPKQSKLVIADLFGTEDKIHTDLAARIKSLDDACAGQTFEQIDAERKKLSSKSTVISKIISDDSSCKPISDHELEEYFKTYSDLTEQIAHKCLLLKKCVARNRARLLQQIIIQKPKFVDTVTLQPQDIQKLRQNVQDIIVRKKRAFKTADVKDVILNFAAEHGLGQEDQRNLSEVLVESILKQPFIDRTALMNPAYKQDVFELRLVQMAKEVKNCSQADIANFVEIQVMLGEVFVDCKKYLP